MPRSGSLTVIRDGINRLRLKGGARADSLYDLLNGYVTQERSVKARPGTERLQQLTSSTKGLVSFKGELHVFSDQAVSVPTGYVLHVLSHPDALTTPHTLSKIHFAKPFLGYIYVVAEFDDGLVRHFWLQAGTTWEANTVYLNGDIVEPLTINGIVYKATRSDSANPSWAPNVTRTIGDLVEPTTYNGYYYEVVDVVGDNPTSGATEPDFPTTEGAQVIEDTQGIEPTSTTTTPNPADSPGSTVTDRYGS